MENALRFEIRPDNSGGCRVQLTDGRNHVYWTESYRDVRSARKAISLAKRNVTTAPVLDHFSAMRRLLRLPLAS